MSMSVVKKNKYSDFGFKLQAIEELICRISVHVMFDKRTNMQNIHSRTDMQNKHLKNTRTQNKYLE